MPSPIKPNFQLVETLEKTGQVVSFSELETLVFEFENVLNKYGIKIQPGSEIEAACFSVIEVIGKFQGSVVRNPREDIRHVFSEALGIWVFLNKVVRLQNHSNFKQFIPHLALLNKGTVVQNKRLRASEEASNKLFELLFALVLLDVSPDVQLDHPSLARGNNPDILAVIDGQLWGLACKTIYGLSGKTFFDNIELGVEQIENSAAEIGCVCVNFRNFLSHEKYWPILNDPEYHNGDEPIFGAFSDPETTIRDMIYETVIQKRDQVFQEIGYDNVMNIFAGKKALPLFLAFCHTATGKVFNISPIPTSIISLVIGKFGEVGAQQPVFEKINLALHERLK